VNPYREKLHELMPPQPSGPGGLKVMEVCGTHTMAIAAHGLRDLLPEGLELVSGPGCPVCVSDSSYIDQCILLARLSSRPIVATYGDMVRVPGSAGSLAQARSAGADVRVVMGAGAALDLARQNPHRQVVFLGVGFETTAPATALAVRQARKEGLVNFSVLGAHKTIMPAMRALLADPDNRIDAYLCPGHVSVIIGSDAYIPLVEQFGRPCVVAGFEPDNILAALVEILRQVRLHQPRAASVYSPVRPEGNPAAQAVLREVFQTADAIWRGIGTIPASGLVLAGGYEAFDAAARFELPVLTSVEPPGCRCGDVIRGRCHPAQCGLFGRVCRPAEPVGPCMISSEGACAAAYKYERRKRTPTHVAC
jgi:hydrogenase expression/formation protein HypD